MSSYEVEAKSREATRAKIRTAQLRCHEALYIACYILLFLALSSRVTKLIIQES